MKNKRSHVLLAILIAGLGLLPYVSPLDAEPLNSSTNSATAEQVKTLMQLGRDKLELMDYQGALADFNQVIQIEPANLLAYSYRGSIRKRLEDKSGSEEDFKLVLAATDQSEDAYFARGKVNIAQGNYEAAVSDFTAVLQSAPRQTKAIINRGVALLELGRVTSAQMDFEQSLSISPQEPLAFIYLNSIYLQDGRPEIAKRILARGLEVMPTNPTLLLRQGEDFYMQSRFDRAIEALNPIIDANSKNANVYFMRGVSFNSIGEQVKAQSDLQTALSLYQSQKDEMAATLVTQCLKKLPGSCSGILKFFQIATFRSNCSFVNILFGVPCSSK